MIVFSVYAKAMHPQKHRSSYFSKQRPDCIPCEALWSPVGISLTPACLTKNPGQADEEHHTPDIQHASYLENKTHCSVNRMHTYRSLKRLSCQLFWSPCQPVKGTLGPTVAVSPDSNQNCAKHEISQHNSPRRPWSSQTLLLLFCRQWELQIPDRLKGSQCSPRCRPPRFRAQRCVHPVDNRKYTEVLFGGKKWPLAFSEQGNCLRWSRQRQVCGGSQPSLGGGLWRP